VSARNTREGIEVTGIAWIMSSSSSQKWTFTASVPQKMLKRRRADPVITVLEFNDRQKLLSIELAPKAAGLSTREPVAGR
jgi:hypothetical protein